ncbi:MAG: PIN domain-containing protein [Candidatus Rokubacteria bacterium]|nr:PIN domain-containing protein [Candidatus Rokubacteria bacterium]
MIDTGVYIGYWEHGRYDGVLADVRRTFVVRQSVVVLSELRRGARTAAARRLVEGLARAAPTWWTPIDGDWWEAGKLIQMIGDPRDWDTNKRRDFQNDALIALTARRHGATVITTNREDFEILGRILDVTVLTV